MFEVLRKMKGNIDKNVDRNDAFELQRDEDVEIKYKPGRIKAGAFERFDNIRSVDTGEITSIENNAFNNCKQLKTINLPKVEEIQDNVFRGCIELSEVHVKDDNMAEIIVQKIKQCELKQRIDIYIEKQFKISIEDDCAYIPKDKISELVTSGEFTVPNYYFTGDLKNVIITEAFKDVRNLKKLDANATTIIGDNAFENCEYLKDLYLLNVNEIGNEVFNGCEDLEHVYVSNDMVSRVKELLQKADLRQQVFIYVNGKVVDWLHDEFNDFISRRGIDRRYYHEYASIEIQHCYKKIADDSFRRWEVLTEINTDEVTTIGNDVLQFCERLQKVYMPNVDKVGDKFCFGCPNLREIIVKDKTMANVIYDMMSQYRLIEHNICIYVKGESEPVLKVRKKVVMDKFSPGKETTSLIFRTICSKLNIDQEKVEAFAGAVEKAKEDIFDTKTIVSLCEVLFMRVGINKSEEEIKAMIEDAISEIDDQ